MKLDPYRHIHTAVEACDPQFGSRDPVCKVPVVVADFLVVFAAVLIIEGFVAAVTVVFVVAVVVVVAVRSFV